MRRGPGRLRFLGHAGADTDAAPDPRADRHSRTDRHAGADSDAHACADPALGHIDAALEDKLPNTVGGVKLAKFSLPLSTYMASSSGGDKTLYTPWLVKFGKTPDDVNIAIAADLTVDGGFFEQAIQVPGANAALLVSYLNDVARGKGWPTATHSVAGKALLEVIDPDVQSAGGVGIANIYASGDVLYIIVTDEDALLLEAAILLK